MDYLTLYETWKKEKENIKIQPLSRHFFSEVSGYIKDLKEEIEMLDRKTLLAHLTLEKQKNLEKIVIDLIQTRYTKISETLSTNEQVPRNYLTSEEDILYTTISSTMSEIKSITRQILKGQIPNIKGIKRTEGSKVLLVRFLTNMPAIVSSNMKTYGPFKAEDVASLPTENAESLIKRGVAAKIEI
jgi:DNA replication factor GINS